MSSVVLFPSAAAALAFFLLGTIFKAAGSFFWGVYKNGGLFFAYIGILLGIMLLWPVLSIFKGPQLMWKLFYAAIVFAVLYALRRLLLPIVKLPYRLVDCIFRFFCIALDKIASACEKSYARSLSRIAERLEKY